MRSAKFSYLPEERQTELKNIAKSDSKFIIVILVIISVSVTIAIITVITIMI